MNTNDLNRPLALQQSLSRYLKDFLRAPANFGSADRMFSSLMNKPALMLGPNGQMLDPNQNQSIFAKDYLQDRSNIAMQNLQDKQQMAGLLNNVGSSIAQIQNTIPYLNAANLGSQTGLFGGLMGGL